MECPRTFWQAAEPLSRAWEKLPGDEVQVGQEDGPAALKGRVFTGVSVRYKVSAPGGQWGMSVYAVVIGQGTQESSPPA